MNNLVSFIILIFSYIACSISSNHETIFDYHVHAFSEHLIDNIDPERTAFKNGKFQYDCSRFECSNINKIINNTSSNILLISAPYASNPGEGETERDIYDFVIKENNYVNSLLKKHKTIFGFCGIDPLKYFALEEIERCTKKLDYKGVKMHFQGNNVDFSKKDDLEKIDGIFEYLKSNDIPAIIHNNASNFLMGSNDAEIYIERWIKKQNNPTLIFAHAGGGGGFTKYTLDFLHTISEYLKHSTIQTEIYFELSGVVIDTDYPGKEDIKELEKLINEIGIDKFLFGSDYPYLDSITYLEILKDKIKFTEKNWNKILTNDILTN